MYQHTITKDWRYGMVMVLLAMFSIALFGCGGGGGGGSSSGDTTGGGTTGGGTTGGGDTGGGTGGGDTGGGTEMAFLTGNVSYPSAGLTKPFINASGKKSFKMNVTEDSMSGRSGATVHAFYYDENGNKVETPVTATTTEDDPATTEDESGNFELTTTDPTLYADKLLSVEASFPSLTDETMEVTIRQLIDMSTYEQGVTSVECNPITEAILQQIIGLFAQYNITLSPAQLSAFAVLINQIIAAVEAQLAAGGFEMDETNYYSGSIKDGGAGEELGFVTGTSAIITQYETTSLMSQMTDDQKKAKLIEFLSLMGFSVSAGNGQIYAMVDPGYFRAWYQSDLGLNSWGWYDYNWGEIDIDPVLVPGFAPATFDSATDGKIYGMAKGIFLVDPALIFVDEMKWGYDDNGNWGYFAGADNTVDELLFTDIDANGDGLLNDTVHFDVWKKQQLFFELTDLPSLSLDFVDEVAANLSATTTIADIGTTMAQNFQWMKYDTSWMDYTMSADTTAGGGSTSGGGTSAPPAYKANAVGASGSEDNYWIGNITTLTNDAGQVVPVKDFEIVGYLTSLNDDATGKLPATPLELANKIANAPSFVLQLYQDCLNDAMEKVWDLNDQHMNDTSWTWIDPWAEINQKMTDLETIKTFVTDSTSFSTFTVGTTSYTILRRPIWESERDMLKNIIFASIPAELLGTALTKDTQVNLTTAIVLTMLVAEKQFRIDTTQEWVKTNSYSWYDWYTNTTVTETWTEINWANVKWLEPKKILDNPLKEIFNDLLPTFAPATWVDETLSMQIETYGLMFSFDWTGGGGTGGGDTGGGGGMSSTEFDTWTDADSDWVNDITVDVSAQIVKSDANGNAQALSDTEVSLYTVDWSWAGGDALGTQVGIATFTSAYGVFYFYDLDLYTQYIASFTVDGQSQEYWIYTDPWSNYVTIDKTSANPDVDLDDDGMYDTYTIHVGMWEGDPMPGTETADNWQRSYPYWSWTNTYPGGGSGGTGGGTGGGYTWFSTAYGYFYDYQNNSTYTYETRACDLSIGNSWDWKFYVDSASLSADMVFVGYDETGTKVDQLQFPNGAAAYDVSEAYLGSTINDIYNNKGTKWTTYADLVSNSTALAGVATVTSPWDYYGNYMPSVFLVEPADVGLDYAYLVEVTDVYEWWWDEYDWYTYTVIGTQYEDSMSFNYAMVDKATGELKYPENLDVLANAKTATELWPLVDGAVYNYDIETVNVTLTTVPVLNVPGYAFAGLETWYLNLDADGNMRLLAMGKDTELVVFEDATTLESGLLLVPANAFSGWSHWANYNVNVYDATGTTLLNTFTTSYSANIWDYTDWSVYPTPPTGDYSGNAGTVSGCLSLNISLYASSYDTYGYYTTIQNEYMTLLLAPGWGTVDAYGNDYMNYEYWEEFLYDVTLPGVGSLVLNDVSGVITGATASWGNTQYNHFYQYTDAYGYTYYNNVEETYSLTFNVTTGSSITSVVVKGLGYYDKDNSWYWATKDFTLTSVSAGVFEGTYTFLSNESPASWYSVTIEAYTDASPTTAVDSWYFYVGGAQYPAYVQNPYGDWYYYEYGLYSYDQTIKFDYMWGASSWSLTVTDATNTAVIDTGVVVNDATNPWLYTDYYGWQQNWVDASVLDYTNAAGTPYTMVLSAWYADGSYTERIIDFMAKP